jgi:hypothetical protein
MASATTLSDRGLIRGSVKVTIDGYVYLLKTGQRQKPVISNFEKDENGRPLASSHVADFEKISGEIMAYNGTPEPSQLFPFPYDGKYWTVGNLTFNYATEGLRSYACEVTQLAGTAAADFVTSTV